MNAGRSPRPAQRAPQLSLGLSAPPLNSVNWGDGSRIAYLGGAVILRLGTERTLAALSDNKLHLPLPPEASARQIQDSVEAWLRQQCISYVEDVVSRSQIGQLVLATWGVRQAGDASQRVRRPLRIHLSFAARSPWIAVEDSETLRCNWRMIELAPAVITQHTERAMGQLVALRATKATTDMFGALPA